MKAHIDVDHATVTKRFKKEVNNLMQGKKEIQLTTKKNRMCMGDLSQKTYCERFFQKWWGVVK